MITRVENAMEVYKATKVELDAVTGSPLGCVGYVVKAGACDWYMWNGTSWDYKGAI